MQLRLKERQVTLVSMVCCDALQVFSELTYNKKIVAYVEYEI